MAEQNWLVEIGCEEIPARFVVSGVQQLREKLTRWLEENRLSFGEVHIYATPRRLAVQVENVADAQADVEEEVRGPAKRIAVAEDGSWTKAAQGFARKQGIGPDQLQLREHKGETYVFAHKHQKGKRTATLIEEGLADVLKGLHFPKAMRWGNRRTRFIRPVRWLVCLFGEEVIPVEWAGVTGGNRTFGHRFLGGQTEIKQPVDYVETLRQQKVMVDIEERRKEIRQQLRRMEEQKGWRIPVDEELLEEVTHLVEMPTALSGSFDERFLELPEAVLIITMREHQRYFPVRDQNHRLLPHFVTVRNGDSRALEKVAKGNEKVLSARLADARFFYEEDLKLSISTAVSKLDQVVYLEGLGSVGDQARRIRKLTKELADHLGLEDSERSRLFRAADICKFDLSTQMVDEFPELSGVMGEDYARRAGEDPEVAQAIKEHHYPRFAGDRLPEGQLGALISLADKIDAVVAAFSLGIQPTGSQDPYGLRRKASAVVHILMDRDWSRLPLSLLIDLSLNRLQADGWLQREREQVKEEISAFFHLRLKGALQEEKIRYDLIDAVLLSDLSSPQMMLEKARVLMDAVAREDFKMIVEGFSRASNLAAKGGSELQVNRDLLEVWAERQLYASIRSATEDFTAAEEKLDAEGMFAAIAKLAPAIHRFFDDVMVMVEDETTRINRLALLQETDRLTKRFAAFNKIVFSS